MAESDRQQRIAAIHYDYTREPTERVERCNLCDSTSFMIMAWRDRYRYPVEFAVCRRCGLGFLAVRPTAGAYSRFYGEVYRPLVSAYHGRRIDAVTVQDDQRGYAEDLRRLLEPRVASGGAGPRRLVDIGGSTGLVAKVIADALGMRAIVLDPSPDELAQARAKGLETVRGLIEDWDVASHGRADLILVCQTIDHLLDVRGSLTKLHGMLADDGLLYVDFVDFTTVASRHGSVAEAIKIDHPYSISEPVLEAYLRVAGFEPVVVSVLPDGHHVGALCRKVAPTPLERMVFDGGPRVIARLRDIEARRA